MAKRPNLGQITSPVFTVSQLNEAYSKIDAAFGNTLSRDGSTPNTMLADLDMNSNDILNVDSLQSQTLVVDNATIGGKLFTGTIEWRSDWVTGTLYKKLDLVKRSGSLYICLEEHTSGVFMTDLANLKWEVFVNNIEGPQGPQGNPGVGVPVGGSTGQVLTKSSGSDYDTTWSTPSNGTTNLSYTPSTRLLESSTGTGVTLPLVGSDPGLMSSADKTKLDGIAAGANNYVHPNHTGDVTSSGDGATTIANNAVTNAKLADMAMGTIKGRATSGTGDPEDLTGTQITALLDTFTSGAKGLAPASGGGTTNFLRADGTWAAPPGGGGSPGGASGEVQYNNSGAFAGASDVEIEGGQLRLPAISTPAIPAADGVKLFGRKVGGRVMPAFMGPSGLDSALQPLLARNKVGMFIPHGNGTAGVQWGVTYSSTGTAITANVATTSLYRYMRRIAYEVTVPSATAVAGFRGAALQWTLGGPAAGLGGFLNVFRWGPSFGLSNPTHRAFAGMRGSVAAPTDVNPSTLTDICGMGWDSGDANIQFMHNDGSGTATKIDLGASFPRPTVDTTSVYEIALFAPPGTTQTLYYEVTDLVSGAVATGTVTTDIPSTTQLLTPYNYVSVGGTSSVVGMAVMSHYIETDY